MLRYPINVKQMTCIELFRASAKERDSTSGMLQVQRNMEEKQEEFLAVHILIV